MKKLLPIAVPCSMLLGILGLILRYWHLAEGPDDKGLYPKNHIAWILLCVLTVGAVIFFWLLSRQTEPKRPYKESFPYSIPGSLGYLAMIGIPLSSLPGTFQSGFWGILMGLLALCTAALSLMAGWQWMHGKRPAFHAYAAMTLFLASKLFSLVTQLRSEPEVHLFLFPAMGITAAMLASYQLWGMTVQEGNRQKHLFWNLLGACLCLVAIQGNYNGSMYGLCAVWLLASTCSTAAPRRHRQEAPAPQPEEPQAPAPIPEDLASLDTDQLIAQIMKDLEEK